MNMTKEGLSVLEGIQGILPKLDSGSQVANQQSDRRTSQCVLKNSRKFGIPVRYSRLKKFSEITIHNKRLKFQTYCALVESMDDLAKYAK